MIESTQRWYKPSEKKPLPSKQKHFHRRVLICPAKVSVYGHVTIAYYIAELDEWRVGDSSTPVEVELWSYLKSPLHDDPNGKTPATD